MRISNPRSPSLPSVPLRPAPPQPRECGSANPWVLFCVVGLIGIGVGIGASQMTTDPDSLRPTATPNRPPALTEDDRRALDESLSASTEEIDYGELTGVITGRVVDPQGAGVAGVEFTARPAIEPTSSDDPVEVAERSLADYRRLRALTRVATSADDGTFRLEEIGEGNYVVFGRAPLAIICRPGTTYVPERGERVSAKAGSELEFEAIPAAALIVELRDEDGDPPSEASLTLTTHRGTSTDIRQRTWTKDDPRLLFEQGSTFLLRASTETRSSDAREVTTTVGAEETVELTLRARIGLRGHVFNHAGRLERGAVIRIGKKSGSAPPDADRISEAIPNAHHSHDGRFQVLDLQPGEYWVAIGRDWNRADLIEPIVLDRVVEQDFVLPAPDLSKSLLVWAYGPDGSPAGELQFSIEIQSGQRSSSRGGMRGTEQADGSHLIDLSNELDEFGDSAQIKLTVTSSRYGARIVELTPAELGEVRIEFEEPAFVNLTVTGMPETMLGLVTAALELTEGSRFSRGGASVEIPATGVARLGPATPGECELQIRVKQSRADSSWHAIPAVSIPLTLTSGTQEHSVALPPVHSVTVLFPEGAQRKTVNIERLDGSTFPMPLEVPASGELTLAYLPAGRYQIQIFGGEMQTMSLDVQQSGTIEFAPEVVDALEVTIDDPSSVLAQLGFQTGDLIIAIDGKTYEGAREIQFAIMAAMSRDSLPVTVLRGSRELQLDLEPKRMLHDQRGARIRPVSRGQR